MISVRHKFEHGQQNLPKEKVAKLMEPYKTKEGFLHYRLLEPSTPRSRFILLTFWQSTKHYKRAINQ